LMLRAVHSSSMLSRSSSSSSSTSPASLRKNEVGGSCLLSPTTMVWVPLMIEPTASSGRTCEASSKTTRSNLTAAGSRNWLTDNGLIRRQGFSLRMMSGHCWKS